jgi:hypothetical protein
MRVSVSDSVEDGVVLEQQFEPAEILRAEQIRTGGTQGAMESPRQGNWNIARR